MDELPSSRFRKVYASLRQPTVVTVNGHVIGTWTPTVPGAAVVAEELPERGRRVRASSPLESPTFAQYRPAPKPGKRS